MSLSFSAIRKLFCPVKFSPLQLSPLASPPPTPHLPPPHLGPAIQLGDSRVHKTTYAPMIYTAQCVMFLMQADTLHGEVGGELALEISSFVGPCEIV